MAATILAIADAVADELTGSVFSQPFEAERHYLPRFELAEMTELKVSVVPRSITSQGLDRNRDSFEYRVDVAVQQKIDPTPANLYDFAAAEKDQTGWLRNVPHGNARVLWIDPSGSTERWAVVRLDDGDFQAHVLITSHVPDDDGFYPGEVQRYDVKTKAWITMFECKVVDINA